MARRLRGSGLSAYRVDVPGPPPSGEAVPSHGPLSHDALTQVNRRPLSFYVHVPYCNTRCGYCDFNTYTVEELGPGVSRTSYADQVISEVAMARRSLGDVDLPVSTIFVGGGTPTLLPSGDLARIVGAIKEEFGLAVDAEVTTEANPDSVTPESLGHLRAAGFTRISFGMQSASSKVLTILDRTHSPGRAVQAASEARAAGFEHMNLDLIYGTPGETAADLAASLSAAIDSGADHVSAYALIVEDGTRLAAQIRRGELAMPDDDVAADRYLQVDGALTAAGMSWYEISNWSREGGQCRHNLAYWRGDHWWGIGPGAHSHIGGVRWWNVRHPVAYADRLGSGLSPAQAREVLTAEDQRVEKVLLCLRLSEGLEMSTLKPRGLVVAQQAVRDGLAHEPQYLQGRLVLTLPGRLFADALVRDLVD